MSSRNSGLQHLIFLDAVLKLMAAHELGHCRQYLDNAWNRLPAGFVASVPVSLGPELRSEYVDLKARREEAYGDLVGLAWTRLRHAEQYGRAYAWLVAERSKELVQGSHHNTLAWVLLANNRIPSERGRRVFERHRGVDGRALHGKLNVSV